MVFVSKSSLRSWSELREQRRLGLPIAPVTLSSHSHTYSLRDSLWLLLCDTCRVQEWDRALMACKADNIYCLALYRKSLQMPE